MTADEKCAKALELLQRYIDAAHDELDEREKEGEFHPPNFAKLSDPELEAAIAKAREEDDPLTAEAWAFIVEDVGLIAGPALTV